MGNLKCLDLSTEKYEIVCFYEEIVLVHLHADLLLTVDSIFAYLERNVDEISTQPH